MLLELESVHAHYAKSHVLQGVSLSVDAGEAICLLGRNGVGKSTTLKTVMGLLTATSGTIRLRGRPIERAKSWTIARLGVGYVPEDRRVFITSTVRENLLLGEKSNASTGAQPWTMERIFELLPRLKERADQTAGTLSGGEQQLLTIARTLMGNPDVLLIDEPTEGLAPMIVEQIENVITEVRTTGAAVLLVEQGLQTAMTIASRGYVMSKGTIVWSGDVQTLKSDASLYRQYLAV